MGKETRLFKSEERKSRSDVSEFLHQLADRISKGQVVLSQGEEDITLPLPQSLILWKSKSSGLTMSKRGHWS